MHEKTENGSASPTPSHADTPAPLPVRHEHRDPAAIDPRTGLTYGEIARHQRNVINTAEANANPTPGPLADAFAPGDVVIEGFRVRPPVAMDSVILKQINSPLHRQIVEMSKPANLRVETEFTDEEGWEIVFQFTRPCREVYDLLRQGRDKFRETVIDTVGMGMDPTVVALIANEVGRQLSRSFATALKYAPAKQEGEGDTVFTRPPAESRTDSVGGSTIVQGL